MPKQPCNRCIDPSECVGDFRRCIRGVQVQTI